MPNMWGNISVSNAANIKVEGLKELEKAFGALPYRVAKNVLKSATRAGANPITKKARAFVPADTGELRKSIGAKVKLYDRTFTAVAIIGAKFKWIPIAKSQRWTRSGRINPALYAHFVESGAYGGQGATNFMARAFSASRSLASDRLAKFMQKGVDRESRKLGFK
jgi:HK97 gp10 family phage protein